MPPEPEPYLIEDGVRAVLIADTALSARVGQRVRPGVLDQDDALPAVVITVDREDYQQDLLVSGDLIRASVTVRSVSESHREARLVGKTVAAALMDYTGSAAGGAIQSCQLEDESYLPLPQNDDGDGWWHIIASSFEIFYCPTDKER